MDLPRAHRPRSLRWLGVALGLSLGSAATAEPEPPAALSPTPASPLCDLQGQTQPVQLAFALPEGTAAPAVQAEPAQAGCDPAQLRALPAEAADRLLPRPLGERSIYYVLRQDGTTAPVQLLGLALKGGALRLLGHPPAPCPPAPTPPDGGAADLGPPPACVAEPAPSRPDGEAVALLLHPSEAERTPPLLDLARLSGTVRRRIGRMSVAARGRFVGEGAQVAAAFKLRADSIQLAIFGEDGGLRLHQAVPWRAGKPLRARPVAMLLVRDLGGAGRDGILVIGAGDSGPTRLLLHFAGKAVRVDAQ